LNTALIYLSKRQIKRYFNENASSKYLIIKQEILRLFVCLIFKDTYKSLISASIVQDFGDPHLENLSNSSLFFFLGSVHKNKKEVYPQIGIRKKVCRIRRYKL